MMTMGRPIKSLIGNQYGKLTVIEKSDAISSNGSPKWVCRCECGNIAVVERSNLIKGSIKSCGKCKVYNAYDLSNDYGIGYTSKGIEFYFDLEDYEVISQYNWSLSSRGYLINTSKDKMISIHRLIMNAPSDLMVDHINHNKLDNRKENLRLCNASQNNINKKVTGYTVRNNGRYEVSMRIKGQYKYIGRFNTPEQALFAREQAFDDDHIEFSYNKELVEQSGLLKGDD
jgi:hypothetical protein